MPVARYFALVGSVLAAVLLIVGWFCPAPPAIFADRPEIIATAAIRIESARKWPEKIQFDTTKLAIAPPAGDASPAAAPPAPPPEEAAGKPGLETLAQLSPDTRLTARGPREPTEHRAVPIKRRLARAGRSNRVARVTIVDRPAGLDAGEACCQFGWSNDWRPSPNALSRRHAAPLFSTGRLALSQR